MNIRNALHLSTVAVVLAGGTSLMAQVTTGALNGLVTDESGNPIAGARVILESPALFQPRTYMTNAKGEYRALLLPVGNYIIKVSASGKLGKTASDVRIGVGTNLSMPFSLRVQKTNESATVEVVSNGAQESRSDDKVSVNYSAEQLLQMPIGLSFDSAIQLAPGVTGYGTSAQIRGSGNNQIMYRIDGINVKDDTGNSSSLYAPLPDSIEDMQVVLSALNARNGLVQGGQMNIVTKTGSNVFEGTLRGYASRGSWGADVLGNNASQIANARTEDYQHRIDLTVSGPILKDRLWFYVGARFEPSTPNTNFMGYTAHAQSNLVPNPRFGNSEIPWSQLYGPDAITIGGTGSGPNAATYLPNVPRGLLAPMATYGLDPGVDEVIYRGPSYYSPTMPGYGMNGVLQDAGAIAYTKSKKTHYEAKLTGTITDSHTLSFTYLLDKLTMGNNAGQHSTNAHQMYNIKWFVDTDVTVKAWTLNYNGTLAPNWTLEARVYKSSYNSYDPPNPQIGVNKMSAQAYWNTTEPTLALVQDQTSLGQHDYIHGTAKDFNFGPVVDHLSTYNHPETRGNSALTFNVKTFQEFGGQHEIDFGAEKMSTVYNFGRSKDGNAQVFVGGLYNIAGGTQDTALYPTFKRWDGSEILQRQRGLGGVGSGTYNAGTGLWSVWTPSVDAARWEASSGINLFLGNPYDHEWDQNSGIRGPSSHVEVFYMSGKDSENSTTSFWANDIYTINAQWNVLLGFRYNKLKLDDAGLGGPTSNMFEPRAQVKYNPDGKGKNVYSFSVAKLASAYSDQIANQFRGDEWDMRIIQRWSGAALEGGPQPGFDTPAGQNDIVAGGTRNGYTYVAGTNMHGVRFVNFTALANLDNYGATTSIYNNRANNLTHDFKAPYTLEFNLGYQRNYDSGFFRLNLVQRTYKDAWVQGWRDYGTQFQVLQKSPKPGDTAFAYTGTVNFSNSGNDKIYQGIEFNFEKQLTSRLRLGGNYTWAQMTGLNDDDYYNYKTLRETIATPEQRANAVGNGYLAKTNNGRIYLTYVHPVGKGNVSFSAMANSWMNGATSSVVAFSDYARDPNTQGGLAAITDSIVAAHGPLGDSNIAVDSRGGARGAGKRTSFPTYFGKMGDYKTGLDYYQVGLKVQADIPIGISRMRLISAFQISDIMNHGLLSNTYNILGSGNGSNRGTESYFGGQIGGPAGRVTARFDRTYGAVSGDQGNYGNNGDGGARRINGGEFSIGLKF